VNVGEPTDLGEAVVVMGGGESAVAAARVAAHLGVRVTLLFGRPREEMPAAREAAEAEAEGVRIEASAAPLAIVTEARRAVAFRCARLVPGASDAAGRPRLIPAPDGEFVLPADTIILAAPRAEVDIAGLESLRGGRGGVAVDERGETAVKGTFAAPDDLELGLISTAIYRGRRAAETIHSRLRGLPQEASPPAPPVITHAKMRLDYYPRQQRVEQRVVPVPERLADPEREVASGLTYEEVVTEAKRCMSCGLCFECGQCWQYCQDQAVLQPPAPGQGIRLRMEFCTGCKKCAETCPCGYIEMR
jgi:NADPH-dependent glutamate synthase beta subunit-like oxidoreductase